MDAPLHPSELAYAFAFSRTETVIGWGDTFTASPEYAEDWLAGGEARLIEAGRLIGDPATGLNFTEDMTAFVLALANPALVLVAERKADTGLYRLTVHGAGDTFFALSRRPDGMFDVMRYDDVMTAAGACAGFLGASLEPVESDHRIEAKDDVFAKIQSAGDAQRDTAVRAMQALGLENGVAGSAVDALSAPAAAGVHRTLHCAHNTVQEADVISVLTTAEDDTWLLFFPGSPEGPMILEQSSASALTARIAVGVMARRSAAD